MKWLILLSSLAFSGCGNHAIPSEVEATYCVEGKHGSDSYYLRVRKPSGGVYFVETDKSYNGYRKGDDYIGYTYTPKEEE